MSISAALLPEFDQEMATTRRVLERLPDEKLGWKPHDKSMTLGRLASHIAENSKWILAGLKMDSFDLANYSSYEGSSRDEILGKFDETTAAARTAIENTADEQFLQNWSMTGGGQTIMAMPKIAVVRVLGMNHLIHHRGQFSVYLRLANVSVPSIYGPSADEGQMGASA